MAEKLRAVRQDRAALKAEWERTVRELEQAAFRRAALQAQARENVAASQAQRVRTYEAGTPDPWAYLWTDDAEKRRAGPRAFIEAELRRRGK